MRTSHASDDSSAPGTQCEFPVGDERTEILAIAKIQTNGGTQHRGKLDERLTSLYADRMADGSEFPPIVVWLDNSQYWLSDGFHRLAAAKRIGRTHIRAQIRVGTLADARWDSYRANSRHGRRLSSEELQLVTVRALSHPRAATLSTLELARYVNIPETTLRRWRKRLSSSNGEDPTSEVRTVVRCGHEYNLRIDKIGKYPRAKLKKSSAEVRAQLEVMKNSATPRARRLLVVMENWAFGVVGAKDCLAAIEHILVSAETSPRTHSVGSSQ